jgi:hypothetical protein
MFKSFNWGAGAGQNIIGDLWRDMSGQFANEDLVNRQRHWLRRGLWEGTEVTDWPEMHPPEQREANWQKIINSDMWGTIDRGPKQGESRGMPTNLLMLLRAMDNERQIVRNLRLSGYEGALPPFQMPDVEEYYDWDHTDLSVWTMFTTSQYSHGAGPVGRKLVDTGLVYEAIPRFHIANAFQNDPLYTIGGLVELGMNLYGGVTAVGSLVKLARAAPAAGQALKSVLGSVEPMIGRVRGWNMVRQAAERAQSSDDFVRVMMEMEQGLPNDAQGRAVRDIFEEALENIPTFNEWRLPPVSRSGDMHTGMSDDFVRVMIEEMEQSLPNDAQGRAVRDIYEEALEEMGQGLPNDAQGRAVQDIFEEAMEEVRQGLPNDAQGQAVQDIFEEAMEEAMENIPTVNELRLPPGSGDMHTGMSQMVRWANSSMHGARDSLNDVVPLLGSLDEASGTAAAGGIDFVQVTNAATTMAQTGEVVETPMPALTRVLADGVRTGRRPGQEALERAARADLDAMAPQASLGEAAMSNLWVTAGIIGSVITGSWKDDRHEGAYRGRYFLTDDGFDLLDAMDAGNEELLGQVLQRGRLRAQGNFWTDPVTGEHITDHWDGVDAETAANFEAALSAEDEPLELDSIDSAEEAAAYDGPAMYDPRFGWIGNDASVQAALEVEQQRQQQRAGPSRPSYFQGELVPPKSSKSAVKVRLEEQEQALADELIPLLTPYEEPEPGVLIQVILKHLRHVIHVYVDELLTELEHELRVYPPMERWVVEVGDQALDELMEGWEKYGSPLEPAVKGVKADPTFWVLRLVVLWVVRARSLAARRLRDWMRKAGPPAQRRDTVLVWRTARDERVCPVCRDLDGMPEEYWREIATLGPPVHLFCRCRLVLIDLGRKGWRGMLGKMTQRLREAWPHKREENENDERANQAQDSG